LVVVEDEAALELEEDALAVRANPLDPEPAERRESCRESGVSAPNIVDAPTRESAVQPTCAQKDLRTLGHSTL